MSKFEDVIFKILMVVGVIAIILAMGVLGWIIGGCVLGIWPTN